MIENVRQLRTSEFWLAEFKTSLASVESEADLDPILKELVIKSHQSMIDELAVDIKVFKDSLPSSAPNTLT